jgi:hypothetical protein
MLMTSIRVIAGAALCAAATAAGTGAQEVSPSLDAARFQEALAMLPAVIAANVEGDFEASGTWLGIMATQPTRYSLIAGDTCEIVLHLTDPEQEIIMEQLLCEVVGDAGDLAAVRNEIISMLSTGGYALSSDSETYYSRRDATGSIYSAIVRLDPEGPAEHPRLQLELSFQVKTPPQDGSEPAP